MSDALSDDEIDEMCEVLCSTQRRKLLLDLVADDARDVSKMPDVPWDLTETEESALQKRHLHLPKLEEHSFVEWDREAGVVTRGPRFEDIRPLLEALETRTDELLVE